MLPCLLKDGRTKLPVGAHYRIARNGMFLAMHTRWFRAIVPAAEINGLLEEKPHITIYFPPIDRSVVAQAVMFFREVYLRKRTEAAVLLYFHPQQEKWALRIPPQRVSSAHVSYDRFADETLPPNLVGFQCVGTMHSHANMTAFHSGTDIHDEAAFDGIHVTVGKLGAFPRFTIDPEFVVNGHRFACPAKMLSGMVPFVEKGKKDDDIAKEGSEGEEATEEMTGESAEKPVRWWRHAAAPYYTLDAAAQEFLKQWTAPPEWFAQIADQWRTLLYQGDHPQGYGRETEDNGEGEDGGVLPLSPLSPQEARAKQLPRVRIGGTLALKPSPDKPESVGGPFREASLGVRPKSRVRRDKWDFFSVMRGVLDNISRGWK